MRFWQLNNNDTPMGMAVGMPEVKGLLPAAVDLAKNPLAETHEFKQACSICYVKTGEDCCHSQVFVCVCVSKRWANILFCVIIHRARRVGLHTSYRGAQMQKGRFARQNQTFSRQNVEAHSAQANKNPICRTLLHLQR